MSLWEATVKHQLGKLPLPQSPDVYLPAQRQHHQIDSLALDEASVTQLASLPLLHRDPFDRMLVALAQAEGLELITADARLAEYGVRTVNALR